MLVKFKVFLIFLTKEEPGLKVIFFAKFQDIASLSIGRHSNLDWLLRIEMAKKTFELDSSLDRYRMRAIITRGLYIYYPIFEVHFYVFKEFFSEYSVLMYG